MKKRSSRVLKTALSAREQISDQRDADHTDRADHRNRIDGPHSDWATGSLAEPGW